MDHTKPTPLWKLDHGPTNQEHAESEVMGQKKSSKVRQQVNIKKSEAFKPSWVEIGVKMKRLCGFTT